MTERSIRMHENENCPGWLALTWDVASFLPGEHENGVIREILDPEQFSNPELARDYWSLAEKLIDLRWMAEEAQIIQRSDSDSRLLREVPAGYLEMENLFHAVVQRFGTWAAEYRKNRKVLMETGLEKYPFIQFWENHGADIRNAARVDNRPLADNERQDIAAAVGAFRQLPRTEHCARYLAYWELLRIVHDHFDVEGDPEDQQLIAFSVWCLKFFRAYLHEVREAKAGKNINRLARELRRVLVHTHFPRTNKWKTEYLDSVWEHLQLAADDICASVCGVQTNQPNLLRMQTYHVNQDVRRVSGMLGRLEAACSRIHADIRVLNEYLNSKKCVAILKPQYGPPVAAFSGYEDSTDNQVNMYWPQRNQEEISGICRDMHMLHATLTPYVVNHIYRYRNGTRLGPFRDELNRVVVDMQARHPQFSEADSAAYLRNYFKIEYSCCERKILGVLDAQNSNCHRAELFVKYSPCYSCARELKRWGRKHECDFHIRYSILYRRPRD